MISLHKRNLHNLTTSNKSQIFIWALFDFANTSYSIVVVTFLYAVYFKDVIAEGKSIGDLYWSIGTSISMLITAFISPVLGAMADHSAGKKRFLLFFTLLCIFATGSLFFLDKGNILSGIGLFVLANIGFEAGLVFYDSFLPEITSPKNYGRVSGYGFAMGYLGSLASLALAYPFISSDMLKETFLLAAAFFLIFSLPLFLFIKDNRKKVEQKINYWEVGFSRVWNTVSHLKNYRNLTMFLVAFFFYIEGVNTVIYFSGNYASSTLNFTMIELIIFFIIVQTTAIVGSILFGILSDAIGQRKAIIYSLYVWVFTILVAYFSSSNDSLLIKFSLQFMNIESNNLMRYFFYFVGLLAGGVMGATQSTSRSFMSKLIPVDKKTEFFGFFSFFGKSSAILGPLVFGLASYLFNDQRIAILSIGIFFIVGLIILFFVKDEADTISA